MSVQPGYGITAERTERRYLTVMFCDLVRSTRLSRELDPEEYRLVLRAYQRACAAVFRRFDGFVSKYEGDGIRVLFGYPRAHEDNGERALRAGLEVIEAIRNLNFPEPISTKVGLLAVRIGVATSMVVVGEVIGAGVSQEMPVFGEAPNLAARLKPLCEHNRIVISESTRKLLGNTFQLRHLGRHKLEGYPEPIPAWEVMGTDDATLRFRAQGRRSTGAFLGREEELASLLTAWESAKQGRGQVVLLGGDPGIGKSRLLAELSRWIGTQGRFRLGYQCSPFHSNSALYPVIRQLSVAIRDDMDKSPSAQLDRLEQWLEFRPEESRQELMPLFAELLSIPVPKGRYRNRELSPEQRREKTLTALVQQGLWLSESLPLVIFLEDFHWADPSSLELATRCIKQAANRRILAVVTYRPEFRPPWNDAHVNRITLEPLAPNACRTMVRELGGEGRLTSSAVNEIVDKADGVPLYIEELTATVLTSLNTDRSPMDIGNPKIRIPASLRDSLLERLDQLDDARETAELAAVIGREFPVDLLAMLSPLEPAALEHALERLMHFELIQKTSPRRYRFRHALIRDAAYSCLLRPRREDLHRAVAVALENSFSDLMSQHPELVALHWTAAHRPAEAIPYWSQAASLALSRFANNEAVEHTVKGLELVRQPHDGLDDGLDHEKTKRLELDLLLHLGTAYRAIQGFASKETMHAFEQALELTKQGVGGPAEQSAALRGLYTCYYVRGEHHVTLAMATELAQRAKQNQDPGQQLAASYMLGASLFWQGQFTAARREFESALDHYARVVPQERELSTQVDLKVTLKNHLAWCLWILGYPEQALRQSNESLGLANELPQPFTQAMALFVHGAIHASAQGGHAHRSRLEALHNLGQTYGLVYPAACAQVLRGYDRIASQEPEAGVQIILQAMQAFRVQGAGLGKPWGLAAAASGCLATGDYDEGLSLLDESLALVERHGECQWQAEVQRLQGELLAAKGERAQAENKFELALVTARSQSARALELRALTSIAELRRDEASFNQLRAVYECFDEGFETHDLLTARDLLSAEKIPDAEITLPGPALYPRATSLEQWREEGRLVAVGNRRLFVREQGPPGGEVVLLLHGFPTCSIDFDRAMPALAKHYRVIAHDHIGFGLSDKPRKFSYSLVEQAEYAMGLWRNLGVDSAHIVAHDIGVSVAMELLARREHDQCSIDIKSLTLSNASVFPDLTRLLLVQRLLKHDIFGPVLARWANRGVMKRGLTRIWHGSDGPSEEDLDAWWEAANHNNGRARWPQLAKYPEERHRFLARWTEPLSRIDRPVHLVWGQQDPIAPKTMALRLHVLVPDAKLTLLSDSGHYPMIEQPEEWTEAVLNGLSRV